MLFSYNYSKKYVCLNGGENQYDDIDLTSQNIVKARYVRSVIPYDNGNMFIEALPHPREGEEEIFAAYNRDIGLFSEEDKANMKLYEKLSAVSLLRQIRIPLPFHQNLEEAVYLALLNSYRNRRMVSDRPLASDTEIVRLKGTDSTGTNAGFSLLGYSGCGKSSALEILFSNYPKVIIHEIDDTHKIPQIVYLVVNCAPNSNFSALYSAIGAAIDNALGYTEPVYETVVNKARNLGAKADKIREFIEKFSIGIIVFDEIQLINFSGTKENSIEGLMTLANKTKVAMGVVGTEDAFSLMFSKLRTGRRFGETIIGHEYCKNYAFFRFILANLFRYQWFDTFVQPTEEITKALYEESKGIIDQLIGIYIFMQIDYLKADKKPVIDEKYIKSVTGKHYPGLKVLLECLEDPIAEEKRAELVRKGDAEIATILAAASKKQQEEADAIMESVSKEPIQKNRKVIMDIVNAVIDITDEYDMNTVMTAAAKEIQLKTNQNATTAELKKKTFQRLNRQKKRNNSCKGENTKLDDLHISMLEDIMS